LKRSETLFPSGIQSERNVAMKCQLWVARNQIVEHEISLSHLARARPPKRGNARTRSLQKPKNIQLAPPSPHRKLVYTHRTAQRVRRILHHCWLFAGLLSSWFRSKRWDSPVLTARHGEVARCSNAPVRAGPNRHQELTEQGTTLLPAASKLRATYHKYFDFRRLYNKRHSCLCSNQWWEKMQISETINISQTCVRYRYNYYPQRFF